MKLTRTFRHRAVAAALTLVVVLAASSITPATGEARRAGAPAPTPKGYGNYLVFMADGVYPSGPPVLFGEPAESFQRDVMGRSDSQIADLRAEATALYLERFGLDFSNTDQVGAASLHLFIVDPALRYRAYTAAGEYIPADGWEIRDGGWLVVVGGEGTTLTGTWGGEDGTFVPPGTMIAFGDYSIARRLPSGQVDPLVIRYRAIAPMIPGTDGSFWFQCEVEHAEWGLGLAQGLYAPALLPGDRIQANIRTVVTFPGHPST